MLKMTDRPFDGPAAANESRIILPLVGEGLRIVRRGRPLVDVGHVSFLGDGIVALMGPNGAGKSLLLRCLAGLVVPDAGSVSWAGAPPDRGRAARLGFVLQKPVLLRRSALSNIRHALGIIGVARGEATRRAEAALQSAGLAPVADTPARLLSGGEQQRLAIARALALEPDCLFLDEPTASLDPASVAAIETTVRAASAAGVGVVFVTHDPRQARRIAARVVFMDGGRIVEDSAAKSFFEQPESEAGRAFLSGRLLIGKAD